MRLAMWPKRRNKFVPPAPVVRDGIVYLEPKKRPATAPRWTPPDDRHVVMRDPAGEHVTWVAALGTLTVGKTTCRIRRWGCSRSTEAAVAFIGSLKDAAALPFDAVPAVGILHVPEANDCFGCCADR